MIYTERVYDYDNSKKAFTILVDRLWPRGISKEDAFWDEWWREIAPGNELRKWFAHDKNKWDEFKSRYLEELKENRELIIQLKKLEKKHGTVVLLYAARDTEHNQANIIKEFISQNKD